MHTNPFAQTSITSAAMAYYEAGFSVIPCRVDKRPAIDRWQQFQTQRAGLYQMERWFDTARHHLTREAGQGHTSIGLVLGRVSGNVVAIDLDGSEAVQAFAARFPQAAGRTLAVQSGSGTGRHLYFRVDKIPANINVRTASGGFEIRGNGCYVIAPPSPHPSGQTYRVQVQRPIAHCAHLEDIRSWFASLRTRTRRERSAQIQQAARPAGIQAAPDKRAYLDAVVSRELARVRTATVGMRNNALFYAAVRLANFCAGGELDQREMQSRLLDAARSVGTPDLEAQRTVASGFRIGCNNPRTVPRMRRRHG